MIVIPVSYVSVGGDAAKIVTPKAKEYVFCVQVANTASTDNVSPCSDDALIYWKKPYRCEIHVQMMH